MITVLFTNDERWVITVGPGAVVDVVPVHRLPRDWVRRAAPNTLTAGAWGLAQAAAELAGLRITHPEQAVPLPAREVLPGPRHPALRGAARPEVAA